MIKPRNASPSIPAHSDAAVRQCEAHQQRLAAVGCLASGVAHEINNLLQPIINLSRRVASGTPSEDEKRRYLDTIIAAGVRASEIVSGLLATVRPGAGQSDVVSLGEAVRRGCDAIRPIVPSGIQFEIAIADGDGAHVCAGEMLQVLTNLATNAIHASAGNGRIVVDLKSEGPRGYILTVSDNGEGMDDATRKRALEPFFTTKEVGQGTGLGLSIVSGMVRGWGGTIDIESEPGRGSAVIIRIAKDRVGANQNEMNRLQYASA